VVDELASQCVGPGGAVKRVPHDLEGMARAIFKVGTDN